MRLRLLRAYLATLLDYRDTGPPCLTPLAFAHAGMAAAGTHSRIPHQSFRNSIIELVGDEYGINRCR